MPINLFAADSPAIITSIRPLQSIIANLTKDVDNNIGLIIDRNESLHNYHLKPSKTRQLYHSKIVIIIDKNFEVFLNKSLDNLDLNKQAIIEVAKLNGVKLQHNLIEEEHDYDHEHHHHHHHINNNDYHLWLDIDIVKNISVEVAKKLSEIDADHKTQYNDNLKAFIAKLETLDKRMREKLVDLKDKNFIVTHNAYQYLINRYGLNMPKSITIDHDHNIGAKSFLALQKSIAENKVQCIFEEPQFQSKIIQNLKDNSKIKIGKLDAEWGPEDASTEDAYFAMMNNLADNFVSCLK